MNSEVELFGFLDDFNDGELFRNFSFFQFIDLIGSPLRKATDDLKKKYNFDQIQLVGIYNHEGKYIKINGIFNKVTKELTNITFDGKDISTFIYNSGNMDNQRFNLGKDDYLDNDKIMLSKYSLNANSLFSRKNDGKKVYLSTNIDLIARDPKLKKLTELLFKYNNMDNKFKERMSSFEVNVHNKPKFVDENKRFFLEEEERNGDVYNRICIENLVKGQVYFVQGPPGVGKTTVITNLINQNNDLRFQNRFTKIIVASSFHSALNNVIERLIDDDLNSKKNNIFDKFQFRTVLYSNRNFEKIKDSEKTQLISLDSLISSSYKKAESFYKNRLEKNKQNINDFLFNLDIRTQDIKKDLFSFDINKKYDDSFKFDVCFKICNKDADKDEVRNDDIDYKEDIRRIMDLSKKYSDYYNEGIDSYWLLENYASAIKSSANVYFTSLDTLDRTLDSINLGIKTKILIIIDEASKSKILHYLTLLDNIENYTLLIIGDPNQLNQSLVFKHDYNQVDFYSELMARFELNSSKLDKNQFPILFGKYGETWLSKRKDLILEFINFINMYCINAPKNEEFIQCQKKWKTILTETFFEKLFKYSNDERKQYLKKHRRSCEEIFNITKDIYKSDKYNYEWVRNKEKSKESEYLRLSNHAIVELHDNVSDFDETKKVVRALIEEIYSYKIKNKDYGDKLTVGVISFYAFNCKELKNYCFDIKDDNLSFMTIDSAQGKEFDIVILDLSIISSGLTKYVYDEYQRLNVAVSRAVNQLFIVREKVFAKEYKRISNELLSKNSEHFKMFHSIMDNIEKQSKVIDYE